MDFLEIKKLSFERKIKNKKVNVFYCKYFKDVVLSNVIYVTKSKSYKLPSIYKKYKGKNTLIISDRSNDKRYSVINLNKEGAEQPFTINEKLQKEQKLKFSIQLINLGGDRATIKKMYGDSSKKIEQLQKELNKAKEEIKTLKYKVIRLESKINQ